MVAIINMKSRSKVDQQVLVGDGCSLLFRSLLGIGCQIVEDGLI